MINLDKMFREITFWWYWPIVSIMLFNPAQFHYSPSKFRHLLPLHKIIHHSFWHPTYVESATSPFQHLLYTKLSPSLPHPICLLSDLLLLRAILAIFASNESHLIALVSSTARDSCAWSRVNTLLQLEILIRCSLCSFEWLSASSGHHWYCQSLPQLSFPSVDSFWSLLALQTFNMR